MPTRSLEFETSSLELDTNKKEKKKGEKSEFAIMSVAVSTGPMSLTQFGLSLSNAAFVYSAGSKLGNWFFASR